MGGGEYVPNNHEGARVLLVPRDELVQGACLKGGEARCAAHAGLPYAPKLEDAVSVCRYSQLWRVLDDADAGQSRSVAIQSAREREPDKKDYE